MFVYAQETPSGNFSIDTAEPQHRTTIDTLECDRQHDCTADSVAVVALVTGVGRVGGTPGAYWSGGPLSYLVEHPP